MVEGTSSKRTPRKRPWGLRWRSSVGFVTFAVTLGLFTDILVYSLIIPVIPYQLEALGYGGVGGKVSWLLVAFSGTLVLATPPIAYCSEVYRNRKLPLLAGIVALIGSQVMFMEAPTYWLMVLARSLQGASSTVVWTVGLALLCDTVPERILGRQFAITNVGITIGNLVAPPVAGILYQRWGFRSPFIFGIAVAGGDLLARMLLIERHEAMKWGVDPMGVAVSEGQKDPEAPLPEVVALGGAEKWSSIELRSVVRVPSDDSLATEGETCTGFEIIEKQKEGTPREGQSPVSTQPRVILLPHIALFKLMKSSRAAVCIFLTLVWGFEWIAQETAVVLHMNRVWGLDSHKAGIALIATVVPTILSGFISGRLADKYGPAPVGCAILLLSLPWYGLLTIEGPLAAFLTFFALEALFVSSLIPVLMLELSFVGTKENIGSAHVYGAFTLAYGIGATAGPVVAGQMYDHLKRGWFVIKLTALGWMFAGLILAFFMLGERPLGLRLFQRQKKETSEEKTPEEKHNVGRGCRYHIDLTLSPDLENDLATGPPGLGVATNPDSKPQCFR